jgi:hypothetical protein
MFPRLAVVIEREFQKGEGRSSLQKVISFFVSARSD